MKPKQSFDKPHNPDMKLFAIYPDFWREKWGERPLLGHVRATDKFSAIRKAYDNNLVRVNITFRPDPIEVTGSPHRYKRNK